MEEEKRGRKAKKQMEDIKDIRHIHGFEYSMHRIRNIDVDVNEP